MRTGWANFADRWMCCTGYLNLRNAVRTDSKCKKDDDCEYLCTPFGSSYLEDCATDDKMSRVANRYMRTTNVDDQANPYNSFIPIAAVEFINDDDESLHFTIYISSLSLTTLNGVPYLL